MTSVATPKPPQDNYQQYFFSPTFQCYTSPLFYRSLLLELEWVSSVVDDCKNSARQLVWSHLFSLSGAPKGMRSNKPILPVVQAWSKSTTMNLLAIELLYLAFATALNQEPDFIKDNLTSKHQKLATALQAVPSMPGGFPQQQTFRQSVPVPQAPKPPTEDSTRGFAPGATPLLPGRMGRVAQPTTEDIFTMLIQLQSWKTPLDQQPSDVKKHIWTVLERCEGSAGQQVDFGSFTNTINMWAQDIVPNMKLISNLHAIVSQLISRLDSPSAPMSPQPAIPAARTVLPQSPLKPVNHQPFRPTLSSIEGQSGGGGGGPGMGDRGHVQMPPLTNHFGSRFLPSSIPNSTPSFPKLAPLHFAERPFLDPAHASKRKKDEGYPPQDPHAKRNKPNPPTDRA